MFTIVYNGITRYTDKKIQLYNENMLTSKGFLRNSHKKHAPLSFSTVTCDVGSAAFNYDMRRLNEILDVPKAWYKRELYRRMFLGKSAVFTSDHARTQNASER